MPSARESSRNQTNRAAKTHRRARGFTHLCCVPCILKNGPSGFCGGKEGEKVRPSTRACPPCRSLRRKRVIRKARSGADLRDLVCDACRPDVPVFREPYPHKSSKDLKNGHATKANLLDPLRNRGSESMIGGWQATAVVEGIELVTDPRYWIAMIAEPTSPHFC